MNLHEQRYNKMIEDMKAGKKISRTKAVRLFCLSCCGFQQTEVNNCCGTNCVLFPFRKGAPLHGKKLIKDIKEQDPKKDVEEQ